MTRETSISILIVAGLLAAAFIAQAMGEAYAEATGLADLKRANLAHALPANRKTEFSERLSAEALITADHGNVEQMSDHDTGQAHTAHTCEPVPFVYVGPRQIEMRDGGILSDVAPTLLTLMGLSQPAEMTGRSIITRVQ